MSQGLQVLQVLKGASVGVLALLPVLAVAQNETTEAAPAESAAPAAEAAAPATSAGGPELKLTPTARAQVFSTLSDTAKNGFMFDVYDARLGVNGEYGVGKFKLDIRFPGNKTDSEAWLYEAKVGFGTWLGTLNTGRIRNTEFVGYGLWDERWTPGFGAIDGIQLATAHEFGPAKVSAGVTLGNGLGATWANTPGLPDGDTGIVNGSAVKTDMATVLTLGVEVAGAKVYAGYGMDPNRYTALPTSDDPDTTENEATTGSVVDLTHAEVGLGYGMEGVTGGVWYAVTTTTGTKAVKENEGGTVSTTGSAAKDETSNSMLGLGVTVDSRLWGMTNLLQDGDRLAFGVNYSMFSPEVDGKVAKDADNKELSETQIGISAGYNAGDVFNTNLHFVMDSSDAKKFSTADGKAETSRTRIVLESGIYL
jgi:hypothetical protein